MSNAIDLTQDSESEDEDLKLAIAMSLSEQEQDANVTLAAKNDNLTASIASATSTTNGISGLDRKQMEADRLARLKRKRGTEATISPPPLSRQTRSPAVPPQASIRSSTTTTTSPPSAPTTLEYPNGTILRTYVSSHPSDPRAISFASLIGASTLQSALLSSYIWDFDWLLPHFDLARTHFLLVMHAHSAHHRAELVADFAAIPSVRLCFPSTEGIVNCMHSKLMLLFYAHRCRVVVPTANLMGFDWGVGGVMENMVFVMDLPLRSDAARQGGEEEEEETYPFYSSLVHFLEAQAVPDSVLRKLARFDFAATARNKIAFVHTIGGEHRDEAVWRKTGHCGLGRTVSEMGLRPERGQEIEIDFVTSSVGSLTEEFMRSMHLAAMGDDGTMELRIRQGKSAAKKGNFGAFFSSQESGKNSQSQDNDYNGGKALVSADGANAWRENFRFFFPSHQTVASSIGGTNSAGTICFQRRWWENAAKFPRANMRDCVGVRTRVLMHSKIMFVRYKEEKGRTGREEQSGSKERRFGKMKPIELESSEQVGFEHRLVEIGDTMEREHAGWVYVGSANLSESAWGRLVLDRTTKKQSDGGMKVKLNCRNWECGIIVPVSASADVKATLSVFEDVLPVPMEYPGRSYEKHGLEPWFFGREGMAA